MDWVPALPSFLFCPSLTPTGLSWEELHFSFSFTCLFMNPALRLKTEPRVHRCLHTQQPPSCCVPRCHRTAAASCAASPSYGGSNHPGETVLCISLGSSPESEKAELEGGGTVLGNRTDVGLNPCSATSHLWKLASHSTSQHFSAFPGVSENNNINPSWSSHNFQNLFFLLAVDTLRVWPLCIVSEWQVLGGHREVLHAKRCVIIRSSEIKKLS